MILSNTGGAKRETTEIRAQLLHYTIVFFRSDAPLNSSCNT